MRGKWEKASRQAIVKREKVRVLEKGKWHVWEECVG